MPSITPHDYAGLIPSRPEEHKATHHGWKTTPQKRPKIRVTAEQFGIQPSTNSGQVRGCRGGTVRATRGYSSLPGAALAPIICKPGSDKHKGTVTRDVGDFGQATDRIERGLGGYRLMSMTERAEWTQGRGNHALVTVDPTARFYRLRDRSAPWAEANAVPCM